MNLLNDLVKVNNEKEQGLVGLNDEFFSLYVNKLFETQEKDIIIVTPTLFEANLLTNYLSSYTNKIILSFSSNFLFISFFNCKTLYLNGSK